jgi:hypothetical protein
MEKSCNFICLSSINKVLLFLLFFETAKIGDTLLN